MASSVFIGWFGGVPFSTSGSTATITGSLAVTGQFLAADGSASAPSYSFASTGSDDDGFYHAAGSAIGVSLGGGVKLAFDGSGSAYQLNMLTTPIVWGTGLGNSFDVSLSRGAANRLDLATGDSFLAVGGSIKSASATAGIGYATGAGGTITQQTNKSTGVELNTVTGAITMNNALLAGGARVTFTVTNSAVTATDVVALAISGGESTAGSYSYWTNTYGAGSFRITLKNETGGNLSEAVVLNFAVIKGVSA